MEASIDSSTPSLKSFSPVIPYQKQLLKSIRKNFNYNLGTHEVLLSGSIGSAKSTIAAHIVVTHCLMYPNARVLIGRRSLPDLKRTLFQKILEHIDQDLIEGVDYSVNASRGVILFHRTNSEIISGSWADKRYMKFRSLDLSGAVFEEVVENKGDDIQAYKEIKMRVGRLPHIRENWIISCTNPDSPRSHWYKYFMESDLETRHVIYSRTDENPFLPAKYIHQLKSELDPKEAMRMIEGKWLDLDDEVVYYNYSDERNRKDNSYQFISGIPIDISFDFNIAENKPMSAISGQYVNGVFHCAKDFIVHGARTNDLLDEIASNGILNNGHTIRVFGDATGKTRDTRSIKSDYDIIKTFLSNYEPKINFEMMVPLSNPPIRERHNIVNAQFYDANNQTKLYVYKDADTLDEGLRLTKLKKGGNYVEDDSDHFQHVTTALGYWIHYLMIRWRPARQSYRR